MENPIIIENPKIEEEEETAKPENDTEMEMVAVSAAVEPPPVIDYEVKKLARDAKAKRKDEKTVQQVLKSLDSLKTPDEKLSAMCKKYSELLHENRQLQATVKQSEKNINMIHREKEQFRHERSKAVLAKTRMEQLCRELQKLNKAQQEETALKLRVEEEKRKEICITFQSAFAEMNTLTNQNNEKSAKMREENLEMREKIKSVREGIELTEAQLDKVRQQSRLELELAEKKYLRSTLELTAEKEALMEDKSQLLMKLAKYHVRVKEHEGTEQFLRKQIKIYEEKFEEFKRDVKKTTESLKNFRPESREMKKKMLKLEKETALWKQRWEKTNSAVLQMTEIKEKRDAEMITLNNKLSTLQELCKAFQRERTSLIAQLREKNDGTPIDRKPLADENRKSMKQVENISKDCEKLKDNLSKLEGSLSEAVREAFRATVYEEDDTNESIKGNKTKSSKKTKNDARKKSNTKKQETNGGSSLPTTDEIEIDATNDNRNETSKQSEKMENTSEIGKIEASEAEIAILERHEIVLKDIEKVLAEQAILEAKIACVKELGNSITESDDPKSNRVNDENGATTELSEIPTESSEISMANDTREITKIPEVAAAPDTDTPIAEDEIIEHLGKLVKTFEITGISAAEFIQAHGKSEPESATFEHESIRLNDETIDEPIEITGMSMSEFLQAHCKSEPETLTTFEAESIRLNDETINEALEESMKIISSSVDSRSNEAESTKIEPLIVNVEPENKEKSMDKLELTKSIDNVPKIETIVSTIEETEANIVSPSNTVLEIKDNVIEA